MQNKEKKSEAIIMETIMPAITYGIIAILIVVLLVYLIREHIMDKRTHSAWSYLLYALLALAIASIVITRILIKQLLYPAIFAVAAIMLVFVLDVILTWLIPREAARPEPDKDHLEEISRKLRELKV